MRKNKKEVTLPDLKGITVFQSNRVTNARYDYSLIQERVFTFIMYNLQIEINQVMNGTSVYQLDIFKSQNDVFAMSIPMNMIGSPNHYNDIRNAITKIAGIQIVMRNPEKQTVKIAGLLSSVEMPDHQSKRRSDNTVTIEIRRDVAEMLIAVNHNRNRPEQYTKFMVYVAITAQYKYTSKIYKLLCSYQNRRYYSCTLEEFRDHLQISPGIYTNFNDLKRFVLDPVAKELKEIGDIYYDTADSDFIVKKGRKVIALKFTIKEPVTEEVHNNKIKILKHTLFVNFGCQKSHWDKLENLFDMNVNWENIDRIIDRCYYLCNNRQVDHPAAFVTKSLLNGLVPE